MNTLNYWLLVKDSATKEKIKKMQFAKTLLFWLIFPICIGYIIISGILDIGSGTAALLMAGFVLVFVFVEVVYILFFHAYVEKKRRTQILDANDETDGYFIELNRKYNGLFKKYGILLLGSVAVLFVGIILFVVSAVVFDNPDIGVILLASGCVAFVLAVSVIPIFFQLKFAKSAMTEIDKIKNYFYKREGLSDEQIARKNKNLFNIADNQKIVTYMYPDENIRKKARASAGVAVVPAAIVGGICGGSLPVLLQKENYTAVGILCGVICAAIAFASVFNILTLRRLTKKQRGIFEADTAKYAYHIELADETKKYSRKMNILSLVTLGVFVAAGVISAVIVDEAKERLIIFGICFLAWLVSLIAIMIPFYKKYRKNAAVIEQKIDKHLEDRKKEESNDPQP